MRAAAPVLVRGGEKVVEFKDNDNPYKSGSLMLYNEDSITQIKKISIKED